MNAIQLDNITLEVDTEETRAFYNTQNEFVCDCYDCTNYKHRLTEVRTFLDGLDQELGIDLTRDVGQGMDELMPHEYEKHRLYLIPYYVIGKCFVNGEQLSRQTSTQHTINEHVSLTIRNSSGHLNLNTIQDNLTIWIEYKIIKQ